MDYSNVEDTSLTSSKSYMKPTQYSHSLPAAEEPVHYPPPQGQTAGGRVFFVFVFVFFFFFFFRKPE